MVEYKELCSQCKKTRVLIKSRRQKAICMACQFKGVEDKEITDPQFKEFFNLEPALYENSFFLRDIKAKYLRYGTLSEKQIEVFQKVASEERQKLTRSS